MNPSLATVLRTLKASLQEHVIPELENNFARGQAGQVVVTLDWLADGLEEPMQKVIEGNAGVSQALEAVNEQLQPLSESDADRWQAVGNAIQEVLNTPPADSAESAQDQRSTYFKVLDDVVIAAGVPQGGSEGTGPLWVAVQQALMALAMAETYMGPIPLPKEHWR
ncbi:MAG: hypothetical protein HOC70_06825 [Gammaproteobacteria bacterium]|jgi:hypothetical protein|nr:hypothetical protein [Gammaproteobacteria bacterium]